MQSRLSRRLGSLQSFHKTENGLVGKTDEGYIRVQAFSDSIFQITISSSAIFEDFSYAISARPSSTKLSFEDLPDRLLIKTSQLGLTLLKHNGSLVFRNSEGTVINEDDLGLGTSWIGEQVTCYKKLQVGERFIGLGEKTGMGVHAVRP